MPSSPAARTVLRSASTPRRWPSVRGRPRAAAQRPLPSMMMATCRGARSSARWPRTSNVRLCALLPSHRENLFFFGRQRVIDLGDRLVGRLLHLGVVALVIVLADLMVLLELLENFHAVAPHVAHGDARGLRVFMRDLHQLAA